jgi:catechol 2,3-dioxygenase-like lactoylglutathione lyase family enzyme
MSRVLPTEPALPVKMAHFVLRSRNYQATRDWYVKVLNMRPVFENPLLGFFSYDEEHHRLAIVNLPDCPERTEGEQGVDHVAYTLGSLGELLGHYRRLKTIGIEPYWCINHGPTTSMYFRDPDGNQVELQVDNFEKVEDLQDWFRTDAFAGNPLGVVYDPEKLIERYERGDPLEELLQQGSTDA